MKTESTLSQACPFRSASFFVFLMLSAGLGYRATAADLPETLQIFGHLTQAYGRSDVGSIQGTSEDGSTDLRKIAIQFRWQKAGHESVVVQFSHERFGDDVFSPKGNDVEIDWAFYERRLGADTILRIGRLNVPLGVYNDIRDVGTLLPFFNLPISFYGGVLNSAETVDGISVNHTFAPRSDWALEGDIYLGGWDTFQQQFDTEAKFGLANLEARAEDGMGIQLWLNTPIHGLRLGAGALTWLLDGQLSVPGHRDRWNTIHLSIDANGEKWLFRAEGRRWDFDLDFGAFQGLPISIPGKASREGYYFQLGCWVTQQIGVFGQHERTSLGNDRESVPEIDDFHKDLALSLNYRFRPDLMAKLEIHDSDTRFPLGTQTVLTDGGDGPAEVRWMIIGLSVSF